MPDAASHDAGRCMYNGRGSLDEEMKRFDDERVKSSGQSASVAKLLRSIRPSSRTQRHVPEHLSIRHTCSDEKNLMLWVMDVSAHSLSRQDTGAPVSCLSVDYDYGEVRREHNQID